MIVQILIKRLLNYLRK